MFLCFVIFPSVVPPPFPRHHHGPQQTLFGLNVAARARETLFVEVSSLPTHVETRVERRAIPNQLLHR